MYLKSKFEKSTTSMIFHEFLLNFADDLHRVLSDYMTILIKIPPKIPLISMKLLISMKIFLKMAFFINLIFEKTKQNKEICLSTIDMDQNL